MKEEKELNKRELKKNILDLKCKFEMQKIAAALTLMTVGILGFIGTFIWYQERLFFGIGLSSLILIYSYIYYKKFETKLKGIWSDIDQLNT